MSEGNGRKWTQERRIKARVSRHNNKMTKKFPLLAQAGVIDDWMTDEATEAKRLEKMSAQQEEFWERMYHRNMRTLKAARILKSVATKLVAPEVIREREKFCRSWDWQERPKDADHLFGVWKSVIKDYYQPPRREASWAEVAEYFRRMQGRKF